MKVKKVSDHNIINTPTCGQLREVLRNGEFEAFDLAIAENIGPTRAHFHREFDEIYFVLDGNITIQTFDPASGVRSEQSLNANELCILTKGTHHKVSSASSENRLCVLSAPRWIASDEHASEVL